MGSGDLGAAKENIQSLLTSLEIVEGHDTGVVTFKIQ